MGMHPHILTQRDIESRGGCKPEFGETCSLHIGSFHISDVRRPTSLPSVDQIQSQSLPVQQTNTLTGSLASNFSPQHTLFLGFFPDSAAFCHIAMRV